MTALAVIGMILGLCGAVLGALAHRAVDSVAQDCRSELRRLAEESDGVDMRAIRDVAVVRYDALEEMSGARSFSLALLNMAGEGIVLTSINGRSETRTYAKIVDSGHPPDTLSPEEHRAVRAARLGQGLAGLNAGEPSEAPTTQS